MSQPERTTVATESIAERLRPMVERIVEGEGLELVSVELQRRILRVTIERAGGVRVGDCAAVSRQLSAALDVEDVIPFSYQLEVTSPGLDRPLSGPRDFARAIGRLVSLRLRESPPGSARLTGRLIEIGEGEIRIEPSRRDRSGRPVKHVEPVRVRLEDILEAKQEADFRRGRS